MEACECSDLTNGRYNDDEPSKPAPPHDADQFAAVQAAAASVDDAPEMMEESGQYQDNNGDMSYAKDGEIEDDDDDDVDFNLGNGPSAGNMTQRDEATPTSHSAPPPPAPPTKGPNAKEDG
jgi:hypothetical protein